MFRLYKIRDYNFLLVAVVAATSILGLLLVNSADSSLTTRQLAGMIMGAVLMVVVSLIDYSWLLHFRTGIYIVNFLLLLMVLLFGITSKGAARWISIGGVQFQPTELCKILILVYEKCRQHQQLAHDFPRRHSAARAADHDLPAA